MRHTLVKITSDVLAEVAQVMGRRDEHENHNPLSKSTHPKDPWGAKEPRASLEGEKLRMQEKKAKAFYTRSSNLLKQAGEILAMKKSVDQL